MSSAFIILRKIREEKKIFLDISQKDGLHSQTIEALLERPKQYLEDYPGMIAGFMEIMDPSDPEHARLGQSLHAFESIQRQINKRNMLPKHLTRLWDIEQSFAQEEGLVLNEDCEIYQECFTYLQDNNANIKNGERIRLLIFRGLIIVAVQYNKYSWKSLIKCTPTKLVVKDIGEDILEFCSENKSYSLHVDSRSTKALWMNYLPIQYSNGKRPLKSKIEL